jgi:hypothetical protein
LLVCFRAPKKCLCQAASYGNAKEDEAVFARYADSQRLLSAARVTMFSRVLLGLVLAC